jgi:hypothetical protein
MNDKNPIVERIFDGRTAEREYVDQVRETLPLLSNSAIEQLMALVGARFAVNAGSGWVEAMNQIVSDRVAAERGGH